MNYNAIDRGIAGAVKVEVETSLEEGTLSKIEHAVKHSLEKKAKSEKFVEKLTGLGAKISRIDEE